MLRHSEEDLVQLDRDHPGFRDADYRRRRNEIARLALDHEVGEPVPRVEYLPEEHAVWRTVWERLSPLHERYACVEYKESTEVVALDRETIPQLDDVNVVLERENGWRMYPVAGLVTPEKFLCTLFEDIFLSTQYIRHHSQPLYTPEPDIVHELVGHAASFGHEGLVELNRVFGRAATRVAGNESQMLELIRLYWYTLEFGAVREGSEMKVYGAGLLSSFGELGRFENESNLQPLDIGVIVQTPFDPTDYQGTIFVAPSFAEMADRVGEYVEKLG